MMRTTRPSASRTEPALHVIELRPHVLARRAATLRERLLARRRRVAPGHHRPLEITAAVLDRARWAPAADLGSWERLLEVLEEHEDTPHTAPADAAAANLLALASFGDAEDHAALAYLAAALGHVRLARLQHRHGTPLECHAGLPVTSRAIRRMVRSRLRDVLAADPETADRVDALEDLSLRSAHALLVQGIDRGWTVPVLDSIEELDDIAHQGTVVEWRHHLAMVMGDPWSAYTSQILDLAQHASDSHAASVIAAIVDMCREQAATGGTAVPRELRGLVALRGGSEAELVRRAAGHPPGLIPVRRARSAGG